jgi:hypothetical protein
MEIIVLCPHCNQEILIIENDINCAIFRHGILKKNFDQINPHETKTECDRLYEEKLIYGCGKPFQLVKKENIYETIVCDYI